MRISVVVRMITTYSDDFEMRRVGFLFTLWVPYGVANLPWRSDGCRPQPVATWLPY